MTGGTAFGTVAGLCILLCSVGAYATDDARALTSYGSEYFSGLNVLTAKDMVNRIPGSEAQLAVNPSGGGGGGQRRGLRDKTDQILIDGKRITGKSNEADQFLERLPADKVVRIEVYDGIVVENEADAGARTINVITTGEDLGSGTWGLGVKHLQDHRTTAVANLTYSGKVRGARYNLGIESIPNGSLTHRFDVTKVAGEPTEESMEERRRYAHKTRVTGSANIPLGDHRSLQLNALYEEQPRRGRNEVDDFEVASDGSLAAYAHSDEPMERNVTIVELGGTYEHQFDEQDRFQILFLRNSNDNDRESEKTTLFTSGETGLNHELRDESSEETVLRGTWYKITKHGGALDVGLELAINSLDKKVVLFEGTAPPLDEVFIPNADQVIRENRAEAFVNYSIAKSRLHYRLGLAAEFSEFDQQGSDVSLTRTLNYLKPSLDLSFNQSQHQRWFLTFKRDVSQLNFDDFVASIDPVDREIRSGNPRLLPETSWNLGLGFENHLANNAGLIKLRVFHHWVEDVADLVPLPPDDYQPGNLADGKRWGIGLTVGFRFDDMGLRGAVINGFCTWQDSATTDPFTGETRRILDQKRYDAGFEFRHDLQQFRGAYGIKWSFEGDRMRYEHDRIDTNNGDDTIELFVEKRLAGNLILRLALNQLPEPESTRFRRSFDPDRGTAMAAETTSREQILRRFATLGISGSF